MFESTSPLFQSLCIAWGLFGVISLRDGERRRTAALVLALGVLLQLSPLPRTADADLRFWPPVVWIVLVASLAVPIGRGLSRAGAQEEFSAPRNGNEMTQSEQDAS